jgi:hypothetical protein
MHAIAFLFFIAAGAIAGLLIRSTMRESWPRIRDVMVASGVDGLINAWQAMVVVGATIAILMAIGAR